MARRLAANGLGPRRRGRLAAGGGGRGGRAGLRGGLRWYMALPPLARSKPVAPGSAAKRLPVVAAGSVAALCLLVPLGLFVLGLLGLGLAGRKSSRVK